MAEYIGNRIVPRHDGVWNKNKSYEQLVIVYEEGTGDSYISRKAVPAGTVLSQTDYWALCSRFSEQMSLLEQNTDADVEALTQQVQKDVTALTASVDSKVKDLTTQVNEDVAAIETKVDNANAAVAANKTDMDDAVNTLTKRLDANVKASTDKSADYAAEVVDARTDDTGTVLDSLGDNLRAVGTVRTLQDALEGWGWKSNYIADENGDLKNVSSWSVAYMMPVNGDFVLLDGYFGCMSGKDEYNNIMCYDRNRNCLGGCFRSPSNKTKYTNYKVNLLPNTAYISVSTNSNTKELGTRLYLPLDLRALALLDNHNAGYQCLNGKVEITRANGMVDVVFPETGCWACRWTSGKDYLQTRLDSSNNISVEFAPDRWWVIYLETELNNASTTDSKEGKGDAADTETAQSVIHVEQSGSDWTKLFTPSHFVFAVFYDTQPFYVAPATNGVFINNVNYGNPAKVADEALTTSKYSKPTIWLAYGQVTLDMEAKTIQVTGKTLAIANNQSYFWIEVQDEPVALKESSELDQKHMLILGYDSSKKEVNLYTTSQFRALGIYGYYIGAVYQDQLWYAHMNPSFEFVYNGEKYKAGQLFYENDHNSYVESRYKNAIEAERKYDTHTMYLASGGITIDEQSKTEAGTICVSARTLGVPDNYHYFWIDAYDPVEIINDGIISSGRQMRILGYDYSTKTVNLYLASEFRALGINGYYIAAWYSNKLYNAHMSPDVKFTVNGKEYSAGELFDTQSASFVPKPYQSYVASYVKQNVTGDEDTLGDIVTPSHWDMMEGRQFSMFYDCLSRHEGRENLYRVTNSKSLTRNEYCLNYTPTASDTDFNVSVIRLNETTMVAEETKKVTVKVNHKLTNKVNRSICICGDSLVDNSHVAKEVYRMLAEDGDVNYTMVGTRGPSDGKHEGRGSWTFARYLKGEDYAGKSNAFWDGINGRLDFKKYCEKNGFTDGIHYFLLALGTNDVSQGSSLYRRESDVQKFIDQAKQFIDALLSEETGFPNCKVGIGLCGPGSDYSYLANSSMGIFRKSINTLNLALIKNFDAGKYHANVTCFAHGLRTNRRLAFPYTDKAVTDRYTETSRTLTNSIHPSARGYQAWADGYYCQIRSWLTEDGK